MRPSSDLSLSLQALVLLEDLNHSNVCWSDNRARHKQSRRFVEYIGSNFLTQVIRRSTRRDAVLDLMLINSEDLFGDVKVGATVQPAATMGW